MYICDLLVWMFSSMSVRLPYIGFTFWKKNVSQSEILGPIDEMTSHSKTDVEITQQISWYLRGADLQKLLKAIQCQYSLKMI